MVKPHIEILKWGIKNTKMRIKHHEKAGKGLATIDDKRVLQKQEKKLEKLKQDGKI